MTFGSFNNVAKLSPATIALWARLLRAVPGARLLLKASQFKDGGTRQRVADAFAAAGVAAERLTVLPPQATTAGHLAEYAVGAHALKHVAERDDVDAAGVDNVEAVAGIVLEEDALAGVEAAELDAAADQRSEIERGLCHALAPSNAFAPRV